MVEPTKAMVVQMEKKRGKSKIFYKRELPRLREKWNYLLTATFSLSIFLSSDSYVVARIGLTMCS